jgi:hypothetical protein
LKSTSLPGGAHTNELVSVAAAEVDKMAKAAAKTTYLYVNMCILTIKTSTSLTGHFALWKICDLYCP